MPVNNALRFSQLYFDQAATARAAHAVARFWVVFGTVGGAQQPAATVVKYAIGLKIQLHRHMAAAVQVGLCLAFKSNRKGTAGLPVINHIKWNGQVTFLQVLAVAQWYDRVAH